MNLQQTEVKKKYAEKLLERHERLKTERSMTENHWQECMDYIVPRKSDVINTRTPGDKRIDTQRIYDTTAIMSNQLLAGALHGMLTNPTIRFFDLTTDEDLMKDEEVKEWLQDSGDRMFKILNESNFQTEMHEVYLDLGAIGTACLFMGEDPERLIHFSARAMKEILIDENNLGIIDVVHREFKWKPRQVVQEFGEENLPREIVEKYEKEEAEEWTIIHVVESLDADDPGYANYKFKSCYVLKEHKYILSESGFKEFPYAIPRWTKTSGEKYGRGPGMEMLPDIKLVNAMMETTLKGAQKTVDPPMMVTHESVIGNVRLTPGGLIFVHPFNDQPIRPLISDARIDFGYQAVEDVRRRIRAGFYGDLFQLREGPQMTATEVNTIAEQQMRLMGPILGRQHFELLRPMFNRQFGIMYRKDAFAPIPEQLRGRNLDIRYSSVIAKAQRMNEGQALTRAISIAAPLINAKPESLDNINADEAIKYVFEVHGVPQRLLMKQAEVKKAREARAQAQQALVEQQQQAAQADMMSKTAPAAAQLMQAEKR